MAHIIYPKNRPQPVEVVIEAVSVTDQGLEPAPVAEVVPEPAIDPQVAIDAQAAIDHTSALTARIVSSSNKSELLIQFCEEGKQEGVNLLLSSPHSGRVSCTYNNLRAWRLCVVGNTTQQSIARTLLTRSRDLQRAHTRAIWGAITDNNQTLINQLLQFTDIIGLNNCTDYAKLAKAAAITCGAETVVHLLALKDAVCSKPICICNSELEVLSNAVDSGNVGVLEQVLQVRAAKGCETQPKLNGNADLLCTALSLDHAVMVQLILDNLPFSTSGNYYLSTILTDAIDSQPEITKAVFDVFGDRLTATSIKASHLTKACAKDLVQVVKALCAKGTFEPEIVCTHFRSSFAGGQTEIACTLFEAFPRVLVPVVIELGSDITDPALRRAISTYLTSLAEQYA